MSEVGMVVILLHVISTWAHDQCTVDLLAPVHVNCSSQDLQKVPDGLPNTTENLILDYNNISLVGKEFRRFHQMNELSLVGNDIHDIPRTVFSGLGQLVKLRLSINNLNNLHYSVISELFNLQEIYLDHNKLHCIHDRLFANLSSVKIIDISNNFIQTLNGIILFHTLTNSLQTLNASYNRLIFLAMPPDMENFRRIDASHNDIQYLCRFYCLKLEVANFSNNHINGALLELFRPVYRALNHSYDIFGSAIATLKKVYAKIFTVNDLIISKGHMTQVNIALFSIVLHKLDISDNNITTIYKHPERFQFPFVVQNVSFARNPSIYLPDNVIKLLENMIQLDVSGTTIHLNNFTLISEIFKLPKLTILRIVGCKICELMPPNVLARYFNSSEKVSVVCADPETMTGHTLPSIRSEVELPKISSGNNTDVCPDQNAVPKQLLCPDLCVCTIENFETVLDCIDVNIDVVMPFFTNYTVIKLLYNNINYLNATSFSSQVKLLILNMEHNSIQTISVDAFQHLTFLKNLDLSFNRLRYLPENVFKNLISLENMYLLGNNLTSFSENIFKYLSNLKRLYLECGIQMEKIHTDTFKNLTKIEILKIMRCGLHTFRPDVFTNLTNLILLGLNYNQIRTIGNDAFINLRQVTHLMLSNNRIAMVGNEAFKGTDVIYLQLNNNMLKQINLNYLVNLSICVLSHNLFKNISFGSTPNIVILILNNNYLSDLDSTTFKGLNKLRFLDLSNNPLNNIPSDLFHDVSKLVYLDVANTGLHSLPVNVFSNLILLKELYLGQNYLQYLTCAHFNNLENLYKLSFVIDHYKNSGEEMTLNYRNITLVDCLYSKPSLGIIILNGHTICQQLEQKQIIQTLFLPYSMKGDGCVERYDWGFYVDFQPTFEYLLLV